MIPHLLYYQLAVFGCLWLFVMLCWAWPSPCLDERPKADPTPPQCKRTDALKAFAVLTHKPPCPLCEQEAATPTPPPPLRPEASASVHVLRRLFSRNPRHPLPWQTGCGGTDRACVGMPG